MLGHVSEGRSPIEANELAGRDVLTDIEGKTAADKRRRLASAQRQVELEDDIRGAVDEKGEAAPDRALENIIIGLDARIDSNRALLHDALSEFLQKFGYKGLGIKRNRADLKGVLGALFDEGGSATDKSLAKAQKK